MYLKFYVIIGFDGLSDCMFSHVDIAMHSLVAGWRGALCRYIFGIWVEIYACLKFRPQRSANSEDTFIFLLYDINYASSLTSSSNLKAL